MRRPSAVLASLTLALALLAGCGDDAPTTGGEVSADRIEVTFEGDSVTPSGDRVEVGAGEEVTFAITADAPGEIHVHSSPEQEFEYPEGTSEHSITIDQPGVVEVESHDLEVVIVQLQVD